MVTIRPRFLNAKPTICVAGTLRICASSADGDELVDADGLPLALRLGDAHRLHLLARILAATRPPPRATARRAWPPSCARCSPTPLPDRPRRACPSSCHARRLARHRCRRRRRPWPPTAGAGGRHRRTPPPAAAIADAGRRAPRTRPDAERRRDGARTRRAGHDRARTRPVAHRDARRARRRARDRRGASAARRGGVARGGGAAVPACRAPTSDAARRSAAGSWRDRHRAARRTRPARRGRRLGGVGVRRSTGSGARRLGGRLGRSRRRRLRRRLDGARRSAGAASRRRPRSTGGGLGGGVGGGLRLGGGARRSARRRRRGGGAPSASPRRRPPRGGRRRRPRRRRDGGASARRGGRPRFSARARFSRSQRARTRDTWSSVSERQMAAHRDIHRPKHRDHLVRGDPELTCHVVYAKLAQTILLRERPSGPVPRPATRPRLRESRAPAARSSDPDRRRRLPSRPPRPSSAAARPLDHIAPAAPRAAAHLVQRLCCDASGATIAERQLALLRRFPHPLHADDGAAPADSEPEQAAAAFAASPRPSVSASSCRRRLAARSLRRSSPSVLRRQLVDDRHDAIGLLRRDAGERRKSSRSRSMMSFSVR